MNKKILHIEGKDYIRGDIHDFLKGDLCTANLKVTRLQEKVDMLERERSELISLCSKYPQHTKRTVWVRDAKNFRGIMRSYLCDEDGNKRGNYLWMADTEAWGLIYHNIATVRVYEPPAEHEWVYRIDRHSENSYTIWVCGKYSNITYNRDHTQREVVECLLTKHAGSINGPKKHDVPDFGVRRLTEGEGGGIWKYGAFYKGRRIAGQRSEDPKRCVENVLSQLTPATPEVKLADLKTVEADNG